MRLAIIGSRIFNNYDFLLSVLKKNIDTSIIECIISGGAKGADTLAERFSREVLKKEPVVYKADWDKYGKSAGYIRNSDIINNSDYVIAFWDGKSKGTKHSIDLANKKGIAILVITFR